MIVRRLAAVLVLVLTGVSVFLLNRDEERKKPVAAEGPAAVDVHFATMMVLHHEQAVRMSRALIAKPGVPERPRLIADFIAHDQQREIDETNAWLAAWNAADTGGAPGAGHGMLTEAQLAELDRAGGPKATGLFLSLMIEHHEGAITMSRSLLDGPAGNVYIHGLAKHVINEQSAEIDSMRSLLADPT